MTSNPTKQTVQVLVATMNKQTPKKMVDDLNIKDCVIINQVTQNGLPLTKQKTKTLQFESFREMGLSRSRNRALGLAVADICIIADDDMTYTDDYQNIVLAAYEKYKDADIIAFHVASENSDQQRKIQKERKLNRLQTMRISSVQITLKRNSVVSKAIRFDERFGAGAEIYSGEENIFLFDAVRAGLKVYYVPRIIACLNDGKTSSWFEGYTKKYFNVKGQVFYRLSHTLFLLLIAQFIIRKRFIYKKEMGMIQATKHMLIGSYREMRHRL